MDQQPTNYQQNSDQAPRFKRRRREMLVFLLPNLFTTANFFCGFFSIISSMRGDWQNAAIAILIAAFADGLDGRIARLTNTQSAFGEQYDSMADLMSFGIAPSILIFAWALQPYGRLGWLAAFMYAACAALRLARFNALKQSTEKRYFQGCPSPIAACAVGSGVLFYREMGFDAWKDLYMLLVAFLLGASMISTIRYRSFKDLNFKSQKHFGFLLLAILFFVAVSSAPEQLMFPILMTYIVTGAFAEVVRFMRVRFKWIPGKGRS